MQLPLQVTFRDVPHSGVLENHIILKAEKLNQFYSRIMCCRVVIEMVQKHHHQGKLFNVRLDLTVPGEELPVTHGINENIYIALREAFAVARRRLEEFSRLQKGDGKNGHFLKIPLTGRIARIFSDQGYGFIETENGDDVYFHHSVVKPAFDQLTVGMPVHFLEEMGNKGPQASRVRLQETRE